jgi:hypothetical protein
MALSKLYGMFSGKQFGIETSKRRAIAMIKKIGHGTVRVKSRIPEISSYDMPTFYTLSDEIYKLEIDGTETFSEVPKNPYV